MEKHLNIRVKGRVQGVFFRKNTRLKAKELGLNGWVKNEPDGSVQIAVEGGSSALDAFRKWCESGPPEAHVVDIDVQESPMEGYDEFQIKRS